MVVQQEHILEFDSPCDVLVSVAQADAVAAFAVGLTHLCHFLHESFSFLPFILFLLCCPLLLGILIGCIIVAVAVLILILEEGTIWLDVAIFTTLVACLVCCPVFVAFLFAAFLGKCNTLQLWSG
jgi:hypothetical protein